MDRSLLVSLSPDEEATLRQIAHGMAHPRGLRERDVARLTKLDLVEQRRMGLGLTATGQQRIGRVPAGRSGEGIGDTRP